MSVYYTWKTGHEPPGFSGVLGREQGEVRSKEMEGVWDSVVGQFSRLSCEERNGHGWTWAAPHAACCREGAAEAAHRPRPPAARPDLPSRPAAQACTGGLQALPGSRLPHFSTNAFTAVPELPVVLEHADAWCTATRRAAEDEAAEPAERCVRQTGACAAQQLAHSPEPTLTASVHPALPAPASCTRLTRAAPPPLAGGSSGGRWASQRGAWQRMGRASGAQRYQRGSTWPRVRQSSCQTRALSTVRPSVTARTPRRRRPRAPPHVSPHNVPNALLLQAPSIVPRARSHLTRPGRFSTRPVSPAHTNLRLSRTRCHRSLHPLQPRRHLPPRLRFRLISPHISVIVVHMSRRRRKFPRLPQNRAVLAGLSPCSSLPRRPQPCTSSSDEACQCRQIGGRLDAAVVMAGW